MGGFFDTEPKNKFPCTSIDDLKLRLTGLRETTVTPKRASHLSVTFEFPSSTVFHISERANEATKNVPIDPLFGNSTNAPTDTTTTNGADAPPTSNGNNASTSSNDIPFPGAQHVREVRALDALTSQPAHDPLLQKLVAKHIITALSSVDNSTHLVRSVSQESGWQFVYHCRDSTSEWKRANAKTTGLPLVGESSGKDGEHPVNLARPGFDCRGCVTITFGKTERKIVVKYEHTALHITVEQLLDMYKPPPPPWVLHKQAEREANGDKIPYKKRKQSGVGGEDADAEDEEVEGALKKRRKSRPSTNPDGTLRARKNKGKAVEAPATTQAGAVLNLSPGEAARRRSEAVRELREAGVDADTLSQEQLSIFENQAPNLQKESLAMLVQYGAERLRVVHTNKDANASANGTSTPTKTPRRESGEAEDHGATPGTSRKRRSSKKVKYDENGNEIRKVTRGRCSQCREAKQECSKTHPECEQCLGAGLQCEYPIEQKVPRKKPTVVAENAADEAMQDATHVGQPTQVEEREASDLGSPGFSGAHTQDQMVVPAVEQNAYTSQDVYSALSNGYAYPPPASNTHQNTILDYSSYQNAPRHEPQVPAQESVVSDTLPRPKKSSRARKPTRKSLPDTQSQPQQPTDEVVYQQPSRSARKRKSSNQPIQEAAQARQTSDTPQPAFTQAMTAPAARTASPLAQTHTRAKSGHDH